MMNLKTSSIKPLTIISKWIIFALIVVSFIGFLDAAYLTAKHYLGTPITCSIFESCEQVTTSQYATVFGIPVALGGALYYIFIFILSIAYLDIKRSWFMLIIPPLTAIGFAASLWFVYLQLFVIKAICPYCMVSAAAATILFILGIFVLKYRNNLIRHV